eukprot:6466656-Amphidinium_carterae.1
MSTVFQLGSGQVAIIVLFVILEGGKSSIAASLLPASLVSSLACGAWRVTRAQTKKSVAVAI